MRSRPTADSEQSGFNEAPASLGVLLLYQDASAALCGKRLLDRLADDPGLPADLRLNLWRFDLLEVAASSQLDAEESLTSDIVVLSVRSGNDLPPAVLCWLDLWFARNDERPRALILLSDGTSRNSATATETRYFLETNARQAGVEFFFSSGQSSYSEFDEAIASIRYRAETTSVLLDETLHRPHSVRDWGINE